MGTRRIRHVALVAIATASLGLTATAPAQTGEAQVVVMADGPGTVTASPAPTPIDGGNPCIGVGIEDSGTGLDESASRCVFGYAPGTVVTFTAAVRPTPAGSSTRTFGGWSDFRCPAAPTCTLTIDGDGQSLVALFDPQIVGVRFAGSTLDPPIASEPPSALRCAIDAPPVGPPECLGEYPLFTRVALTAAAGGEWNPGLCDIPVSTSRCEVVAGHLRWTSLRFGTADFPQDIPPAVVVRFGVRKSGGGSGTVRGEGVDCGARCTVDLDFGARLSLVADPDRGSRFAGWEGACGGDATCALDVGPVTTLAAVFDRSPSSVSRTGSRPGQGRPGQQGPGRTTFTPRLGRIVVSGHGRRRVVLIPIRSNLAGSVRARLLSGRRVIANRVWRMRAGTRTLRLRVPARAARGTYRLRVTVRSSSGEAQQFARTLGVPR
jgi:hypothetical protein